MKIVLQIILTVYTVIYFLAGLNNSKRDQQIFYVGAASMLVALILITTRVL